MLNWSWYSPGGGRYRSSENLRRALGFADFTDARGGFDSEGSKTEPLVSKALDPTGSILDPVGFQGLATSFGSSVTSDCCQYNSELSAKVCARPTIKLISISPVGMDLLVRVTLCVCDSAISGRSRIWTVKGLDEVRIRHGVVSSVMERHKLSHAVAACLRVRTCLVLASNAAQFWKERASDAGWMRCSQ
jgi:hypothetical protein